MGKKADVGVIASKGEMEITPELKAYLLLPSTSSISIVR